MKQFIGVDLGTSAVKLILINETGAILKTISKGYPLQHPFPGWSEQNPEDWWAAVCDGLSELTAACDKTDIAGIGVGGRSRSGRAALQRKRSRSSNRSR